MTTTTEVEPAVERIARAHGFSVEAAQLMRNAITQGHGSMAQFDHPEFGGCGQWMRGGMVMVSAMDDARLKTRVDALCTELSELEARPSVAREAPTARWWRHELGDPDSTGAQDDMRYAYFRRTHRLVVQEQGRVAEYDTSGVDVDGFGQQQGSARTLTFTNRAGTVDLASLPRVA